MRTATQKQSYDSARRENSMSRLIMFGLVVVILVLAFGWASQDQRVVIVPPTLTDKAELTSNTASTSLQLAWGQFLVSHLANVTPRNADHMLNSIGNHLSPRLYRPVVDRLLEQVKTLQEEQMTLSFEPSSTRWDDTRQSVLITGTHRIKGIRGAEKTEQKTYELRFVVSNYRVLLDFIDVYDGGNPPAPKKTT